MTQVAWDGHARGRLGGLRLGRGPPLLVTSVFMGEGGREGHTSGDRTDQDIRALRPAQFLKPAVGFTHRPDPGPSQAAVGATVTAEVNTTRNVLPNVSAP